MTSVPDLDDMYACKTYAELEKIVNDWLNGDDEPTNSIGTSRGVETPQPQKQDDSANAPPGKYKTLDEAFADLEDL